MADEDDKINVSPDRPLHTLNEPWPKPGNDHHMPDYTTKPENNPHPAPATREEEKRQQ